MKPVRWSAHAEASLRDRDIPREEVERTLEDPDRRVAGHGNRLVLLRGYDDRELGQPMVLCVA